jgi:aspartyl protease family protein
MALCLAVACAHAAAAEVALIGVIGGRAAVLALDGGEPKTVKVGQTWSGISVLSVDKDQAVVEVDGKKRVLRIGQHYRGAPAGGDARTSVTLAADARGHFFTEAMINGVPMRFLVDTGASVVVLSADEATRAGIEWKKGRRAGLQTASGRATGYIVKLDTLKVGSIELSNIDGVVLEEGPGSVGLLGMSFLNRVEMKRDGETMTLIRRF